MNNDLIAEADITVEDIIPGDGSDESEEKETNIDLVYEGQPGGTLTVICKFRQNATA